MQVKILDLKPMPTQSNLKLKTNPKNMVAEKMALTQRAMAIGKKTVAVSTFKLHQDLIGQQRQTKFSSQNQAGY